MVAPAQQGRFILTPVSAVDVQSNQCLVEALYGSVQKRDRKLQFLGGVASCRQPGAGGGTQDKARPRSSNLKRRGRQIQRINRVFEFESGTYL